MGLPRLIDVMVKKTSCREEVAKLKHDPSTHPINPWFNGLGDSLMLTGLNWVKLDG